MPKGFIHGLDLEDFSCTMGRMPAESLRDLAALPNTHTLHLTDCTPGSFHFSSIAVPFPSLRHISLSHITLSSASLLLQPLNHLPLESIELSFGVDPTREIATEKTYFDFCSKLQLLDELQRPTFKCLKLHDQGPSQRSISFDALRPLYKLSQLECLHLDVPFAFRMDSPKFSAWGAAWPLLKDFQLGGEGLESELAGLVPQDLYRIAEVWPRLESLCVSLDTRTEVESSMKALEEVQEQRSLTSLRIHGLLIGHSGAFNFAVFLFMSFPRLKTFQFESGYLDESEKENLTAIYLASFDRLVERRRK
ncbi:hypothetical protein BDN72DRAFT_583868 [Pluteus cervinus]|uniref:Uncharacterized protein n=1 Tax=Pluteus cervinus TaxID=181527 RepID=A0ACD3AWD9_9AGAR|nr:hypothetical protein BDN72DRAFT_583868 [Pluteus cervinus]